MNPRGPKQAGPATESGINGDPSGAALAAGVEPIEGGDESDVTEHDRWAKRLLQQVREDGSTRVSIERRAPANLQGHCETLSIDASDFTVPDLIEHVRLNYGGGTYRLRLYGPHGYREGSMSFRVSGPPIVRTAAVSQPSTSTSTQPITITTPAPQGPDVVGLVQALAGATRGDGRNPNGDLLGALIPALIGQSDKRDHFLLQLLTSRKPDSKPGELLETVKAFKELRGVFADDDREPNQPAAPTEPMGMAEMMPMMMMMMMMRESGGNAQANPQAAMQQQMMQQMMMQQMAQRAGMQMPPMQTMGAPFMPGYPGQMPGYPPAMPGFPPGGAPGPMPGYPAQPQQQPPQPQQPPPAPPQPPSREPDEVVDEDDNDGNDGEIDPAELRADIGEYLRSADVEEAKAFLDGVQEEFPPELLRKLAESMGAGAQLQ